MALDYASYLSSMAQILAIVPSSTLEGSPLFARMIEYAELRIYRELDFISTITEGNRDLVAGTRSAQIPDEIFIANSASVITPAYTLPEAGTRNPLQRVSTEFINFVWPSTATQGVPLYYAMQDENTVVLAPTPDAAYKLNMVGIFRPDPLSVTNTSTFLTDNVPDLFVAASAVFGFGGINANYGAAADDPKSAVSWEAQYQALKEGVNMENLRAKAWTASWQPFSPSPGAKESRT